MNWRKNSWLMIGIVLMVTVVCLTGAQTVWRSLAVDRPLDKGLASIPGVGGISWIDNGRGESIVIDVTLSDAKDLRTTYRDIGDTARRVLGLRPFRIRLKDDRTPELEEFYHGIHFFIQEAIATGNFGEMARRIEERSQQDGIDSRVMVDEQFVFIQATKGGHGIYEVIPRRMDSREVR